MKTLLKLLRKLFDFFKLTPDGRVDFILAATRFRRHCPQKRKPRL